MPAHRKIINALSGRVQVETENSEKCTAKMGHKTLVAQLFLLLDKKDNSIIKSAPKSLNIIPFLVNTD